MDQKSIPWQEMGDAVLSTPATTDEARMALAMLTAWDGVVAADSPAATVFEFFIAHMIRRMVRQKRLAPRSGRLAKALRLLFPTPHLATGTSLTWCISFETNRKDGFRSPGLGRSRTPWPPQSGRFRSATAATPTAGPGAACRN